MKKERETAGSRLIDAAREVIAHAKGEITLPTRLVKIPDEIDVKSIREKTGMSQGEFAKTFCISSRSLQDWEQGRRRPESAVRAYLTIIEREPETVRRVLS